MGPMQASCYKAYVHIWETVVGQDGAEGDSSKTQVGHSSIELVNYSQKERVSNIYFSLRPKNPTSVNPFTILLPVRGTTMPSLAADIEHESCNPDRTIEIPLEQNQFEEMKQTAESLKSSINNGYTLYQLLPNCSPFLWTFKALATRTSVQFMGEDPSGLVIEKDLSEDLKEAQNVNSSNCSCAVADILQKGGYGKLHSFMPWGVTPTELANSLQNRVNLSLYSASHH